MKSAPLGKTISEVEFTNIPKHGFWLLLRGRELFLSFDQFPCFKDAGIGQISNVEHPHEQHLYWPDLDIDLAIESIEHPERYPLVSKKAPEAELQPIRHRKQWKSPKA
jgi:hypothetical protein